MNIIYKIGDSVMLYQGDCIETMRTLPDDCVDSIVTDPPYELGFMNKSWDSTGIANNVEMWKECLRVLKPGGHLLSFGGARTYHRMACAIEDAGFEIRDQMQWLYGSGFPKSMNIGKAIDKTLGNKREVVGFKNGTYADIKRDKETGQDGLHGGIATTRARVKVEETRGASPWEGWGTALKPAHEPICLARKPVSEKTVADNVLKWGTGGLNIDACRIPLQETGEDKRLGGKGDWGTSKMAKNVYEGGYAGIRTGSNVQGRFPANIILDEAAGEILDTQSGTNRGAAAPVKKGYDGESNGIYGDFAEKGDDGETFYGDTGGASRFFYCAKTSKRERNAGLDGCEEKKMGRNQSSLDGGKMLTGSGNERSNTKKNFHPTVKPVKLMEYLAKLITPPGGIVLDPFMGSGSTGIAAKNLGFKFIGIEMDKEYCEIAQKRIAFVSDEKQLNMLDAV